MEAIAEEDADDLKADLSQKYFSLKQTKVSMVSDRPSVSYKGMSRRDKAKMKEAD